MLGVKRWTFAAYDFTREADRDRLDSSSDIISRGDLRKSSLFELLI